MTKKTDEQARGSKIFRVFPNREDLTRRVDIFGDSHYVHDGLLFIIVDSEGGHKTVASFYHWAGVIELDSLARERDIKAME